MRYHGTLEKMGIVLAIAFFSLLSPDLARASDATNDPPSWVLQGTSGHHVTVNLGANNETTRRYPSFFATHAAKPWSRTRRRSITLDAASHSVRTIHVSQDSSYTGVKDVGFVAHGDGDLEVSPCPNNLTFSASFKYLYHDCGNQVLHTLFNVAWLMVLFYILGSTASDYFSCTLEMLSDTLRLSPTVAGVTLLAVGNGAPDVFSSVAAFMSSDEAGSIGFSCILGGALFITTVVSGSVALVTDRDSNRASAPQVHLVCFVRDGLFLLGSSVILAFIILDGKVYLWEALLFFSVYVMYVFSVWAAEMLENSAEVVASIEDPLLSKVMIEDSLPQSFHMQQQHVYHFHNQEFEAELEYLVEHNKGRPVVARFEWLLLLIYKHGIERPLALPRQLTIPVIEEERWSRPFAVASCTLAPSFVCGVWILQVDVAEQLAYVGFGMSVCLGMVLGTLAFMNTENGKPPSKYLWLWLGGGFFMSIVWFYVVADQVVASLETLGMVFSINPAILGLTVLAWGNCIGDLVADLALACGGRDGVQIAVSGCYAGPLFNMVVGLGLSLIIACWRSGGHPLMVTDEDGLLVIIGFLIAGLLWALVVMPLNNMRLTRGFGAGLLLIYCSFLFAGMCYAMGWIFR